MRYSTLLFIASGALSCAAPTKFGQHPARYGHLGANGDYDGYGESRSIARQRAAAVKESFESAWDGYYKYAFPNDELLPLSNSFSNSRNGWGVSAVDALSTALVMEIPYILDDVVIYIPAIDWSTSANDMPVDLFETTIRYLGGLLSGYDLLSGPFAHLAHNQDDVANLLTQARNLANNLSYAFETSSGVPSNGLHINNRSTDGSTTNGLAAIGTLVLEWTHLSDLTGNDTYGQLAQTAESYLLNPQPAWAEPWPGLVGNQINLGSGLFESAIGGWNGGTDSFYEYLIKMYVYNPSRFASYKDRWILAADSTIAHLASHPSSRPDLTFLAMFDHRTTKDYSGHLACFDGGNFILGGLVLNEQKYVDFGLRLVAACENIYNQTLTGIGPEIFSWDVSSLPTDQAEFYKEAGFYIIGNYYVLRPEMMESFYYAYRATGNRIYQDWAWNAFVAINATTRVGSGFAQITDVNALNGGSFVDFQESFVFAEVLKYSYLIHAPDTEWQVNRDGMNKWVFNTGGCVCSMLNQSVALTQAQEGHPLKVAGSSGYGYE